MSRRSKLKIVIDGPPVLDNHFVAQEGEPYFAGTESEGWVHPVIIEDRVFYRTRREIRKAVKAYLQRNFEYRDKLGIYRVDQEIPFDSVDVRRIISPPFSSG